MNIPVLVADTRGVLESCVLGVPVFVCSNTGVPEIFGLALIEILADVVLDSEPDAVPVRELATVAVPIAEYDSDVVIDATEVIDGLPECMAVPVVVALRVLNTVPVLTGFPDAEFVADTLGLFVIVFVRVIVGVDDGLIVPAATVEVVVLVKTVVNVVFGSRVIVVELVDVLVTVLVLVPDRVNTMVPVFAGLPVVVRLCEELLVVDCEAVELREFVVERVPDELAVGDLEGGEERVPHIVGGADCVLGTVLETDDDADDVLDAAVVFENDGDEEDVFDALTDNDRLGDADAVFVELREPVPLIVFNGVFVT